MRIYIKFMVSLRCKMIVKEILDSLNIEYLTLELGVVDLKKSLEAEMISNFDKALRKYGLEVLEDKKAILVDRIKNLVVEMIHYDDELPNVKYSVYISEKLDHNYTYLANLFSEVKGITIEQFIISHKIERVKELIIYDELSLTQISCLLNYSSVAHLSKQFKKVTGLTPSFFKHLKVRKRLNLEDL